MKVTFDAIESTARQSRAGHLTRWFATSAVLLATSFTVHSAPTLITQAQFAAQSAGLVTQVENFESYAPNTTTVLGNSAVLSNGTFTGNSAVVNSLYHPGGFCETACLTTGGTPFDLRTFSMFPADTLLWSAIVDTVFEFELTTLIHVEALGNSGLLSFDIGWPNLLFMGFSDPTGLISVSFQQINVPSNDNYNYSFDDVTTSRLREPLNNVPEPGSMALVLLALGVATWARRQTIG
jgi:hypothetical protein